MQVLAIVAVPGLPVPQGSVTAMMSKAGRPFVKSVKPSLAQYRADVREEVRRRMAVDGPLPGPMSIRIEFLFPRPKAHYNARGGLTPRAPAHPAKRPDVDKLARAVLDALTGLVWADDAQVVRLLAVKAYSTKGEPTTTIVIEEM